MLSSALKQSMALAVVMAVLAGCSSTSTTDSGGMADTGPVSTGTASGVDLSSTQVVEEPMPELNTVFYFDFDKSVLKAETRAELTAHAGYLRTDPRPIRLEGHGDERGTREYNMALGERRAKSVRDFLVLQGVDASLIEVVSYGEEYPAVMGTTEAAYSMNRRVELK
ncbi:OmpA family protein [Pseudomaricurvus alcaniphilus]|uniref:peptidoglycan-associated lipoprotein n=1 Tax=Pseudomaricurvus alcaniphilus TaxID=1166482 RepID=UPI00140DDF69|nr:OmpA family protein [Pseudomaricurvus alcaniphilus]NHN37914.1 OmpA family protein [Pseudomaricurvus alcaniphilus]